MHALEWRTQTAGKHKCWQGRGETQPHTLLAGLQEGRAMLEKLFGSFLNNIKHTLII